MTQRRHNIGWWTHAETMKVIEAWDERIRPEHDEDAAVLRHVWPTLADALDALNAAEAKGCPMCPARWPLRNLLDPNGEVIGWTDHQRHDPEPPDDFWECHLLMGHVGPHRHEDGCATFEWGLVP